MPTVSTAVLRFAPLWTLLLAWPAAAEDPSGGAPPTIVIVEQGSLPGAEPPPSPRGGLYLRLALGGGGMVDDFNGPFGWGAGSANGPSGAFELLIGGSLRPGLVLGGGLIVEWVQSPEVNGVENPESVAVGALTVLGGFIHWYPGGDTDGFYLSGLLGGARITIEDETGERSNHSPIGGAVSLAAGYEFLLGDHVGLGGMVRLTGGTLGDDLMTHRVAAFSLLGALSWY